MPEATQRLSLSAETSLTNQKVSMHLAAHRQRRLSRDGAERTQRQLAFVRFTLWRLTIALGVGATQRSSARSMTCAQSASPGSQIAPFPATHALSQQFVHRTLRGDRGLLGGAIDRQLPGLQQCFPDRDCNFALSSRISIFAVLRFRSSWSGFFIGEDVRGGPRVCGAQMSLGNHQVGDSRTPWCGTLRSRQELPTRNTA